MGLVTAVLRLSLAPSTAARIIVLYGARRRACHVRGLITNLSPLGYVKSGVALLYGPVGTSVSAAGLLAFASGGATYISLVLASAFHVGPPARPSLVPCSRGQVVPLVLVFVVNVNIALPLEGV